MGHSHALSGVTIALGYTALGLPLAPTTWESTVAFAVVTAGGAMLPDLDHPQSSIARSWGPLTRALAHVVERVFGGHRVGTHTLLFAVGVGVLMTYLGALGGWWVLVPVFLAAELALGTLWRERGPWNEALAAGLAAAVHLGQVDVRWLGIALGIGCLAHCLGDLLTPQAFRFLWPWHRRLALGLFTTGTPREQRFVWLLRAANVALVLVVAGLWDPAVTGAQDAWPYVAEMARQATGVGA